MSKVNRTFEIANFVITYGDEGLVKNFKNFWASVRDGSVKGKGEVRSYKFINMGMALLEHKDVSTPVIYGRLVKLMTIEAEQIFNESKDTVESTQDSIPSAPSSFFVVELENHKICFLRETRRAPSIKDLEYCLRKVLIQNYWSEYAREKKQFLEEQGLKRLTQNHKLAFNTYIDSTLVKPQVRITAIPGIGNLEERLNKYRQIETISISPLKTNNELSDENAAFLRSYQQQAERLGSVSSKVELKNSKEGLNIDQSKSILKDASDGNFKVKVSGITNSGQRIQGDDLENYGLKITEPIPKKETLQNRLNRTFLKLMEVLTDGLVTVSEATDDVRQKAIDLIKNREDEDE